MKFGNYDKLAKYYRKYRPFEDVCSGGLLLNQREQGMLLSTKIKKGDSIICSALDRYSRSHYGLVNDVHLYKKKGNYG